MTEPRPHRRWPKILGATVVVLVVLVAGVLFALDRILLSQARKQAETLSRQLGRPVEIGGVATKLWGGLGVRVTDVAVGAGQGEPLPLAELRRAEVEADLFRAIRTLGRRSTSAGGRRGPAAQRREAARRHDEP
jgi:AsmA protein